MSRHRDQMGSRKFYRTFWGILGPDLVDVLNDSFTSGSLPFSLRGAPISLIFKKGDRLDHKNWCLISLFNVYYKLCARALAERLLKVLAVNLLANPDIVGLWPPGLSTSLPILPLYDDDTSVVTASESAILAVFDTYGKFGKS